MSDAECSLPAPAGNCTIHGTLGVCSTDIQCAEGGVDGRCRQSVGGAVTCSCTYDTCMHDTDCAKGQTCACHGAPYTGGAGNTCLASQCRVDADCGAGGYCSPAYNTNGCGGLLGYFCHTAKDACLDDSDCNADGGGGVQLCAYTSATASWQCKTRLLCP